MEDHLKWTKWKMTSKFWKINSSQLTDLSDSNFTLKLRRPSQNICWSIKQRLPLMEYDLKIHNRKMTSILPQNSVKFMKSTTDSRGITSFSIYQKLSSLLSQYEIVQCNLCELYIFCHIVYQVPSNSEYTNILYICPQTLITIRH